METEAASQILKYECQTSSANQPGTDVNRTGSNMKPRSRRAEDAPLPQNWRLCKHFTATKSCSFRIEVLPNSLGMTGVRVGGDTGLCSVVEDGGRKSCRCSEPMSAKSSADRQVRMRKSDARVSAKCSNDTRTAVRFARWDYRLISKGRGGLA